MGRRGDIAERRAQKINKVMRDGRAATVAEAKMIVAQDQAESDRLLREKSNQEREREARRQHEIAVSLAARQELTDLDDVAREARDRLKALKQCELLRLQESCSVEVAHADSFTRVQALEAKFNKIVTAQPNYEAQVESFENIDSQGAAELRTTILEQFAQVKGSILQVIEQQKEQDELHRFLQIYDAYRPGVDLFDQDYDAHGVEHEENLSVILLLED